VEQALATKWGLTLAPQVSNADAQDWVNRVYANGGTVSASTAAAVNQFCVDIEAAGIRDRFFRLNLFCGTGLNACLVPLYRASSSGGTPLGGATDTNTGGLFVSGDYNETGASGGLTGGTTRYLTTGLLTSALPAIATGHIAAYVMAGIGGAAISGIVTSWSSGFAGPNAYVLEANRNGDGGILMAWGNSFAGSANISAASGAGNGFVASSRTAATDLRLYRNGSQIGSTSAASVTPVANDGSGFGVFANFAQTGVSGNHFAGRMGGYSIGAGLTAAEMSAYNTAMQAFQTALSRNV
jgi:hypothetical protein